MFGGVRSGYSLRTKPGGPRRLLTFSGDPPPKAAGHLIKDRIAHRLGPFLGQLRPSLRSSSI
jgi:hypothetical protein